ncbi:diguanylate cyclase [Oscillospiraceae bacterium CM]|nr:diguanylate cyclase [Oscillospiraceae bacterium CM]
MGLSFYKQLMTNHGSFKPIDPEYKFVYLLNIVLFFFILINVFFAAVELLIGLIPLAGIHIVSAVACTLLLTYFHRTNHLKAASGAMVMLLCAAVIAVLFWLGHQNVVLVLICLLPLLVYFIIGYKTPPLIYGIFVVYLFAFLFFTYQSWGECVFTLIISVHSALSFIPLALMMMYYEISWKEAGDAVYLKNTELEQANAALRESKDRLRLILDSTAEAIFGIDLKGACTFCNASCLEMLGYREEAELLGKDMHELIHSKQRDGKPIPKQDCKINQTCMEGIATHADDEVFWTAGGNCFDVEYNSYPQYKDGVMIGAVVTFQDNSLRKMHEQQIAYFSSHDSLTGLLNRSYFETAISKIDTKQQLPVSVIMGDLNGLKLTNDIFGHDAGDDLLVKAADVLKKTCREDDVIARLGGDEYVILLPKTSHEDAIHIVNRMKDALSRIKVNAIKCSMSLGCDTKTSIQQKIDVTIKNAESEMYKDKALNHTKVNADMINAIIMSLYVKSPREEQHSTNVSQLCTAIGEALNLPETQLTQLRSAGFLHDIGKICFSNNVLNKVGPLNELETVEFKQHPAVGYRILNLFDNTLNLADSVYSHHEWWDGNGYPRGLKGSEIPLVARIVAVADQYDSLTSTYSDDPLSQEEALKRMQEKAGVKLDPQIVDVFINMMSNSTP